MAQSPTYVASNGDKLPLDLSVALYERAAEAGQSLPQYLASQHPTNAARDGTAFEQLCEQAGVFVRGNKEFGLKPSTMQEVLAPKEAAVITREGVPASRLLFPAVTSVVTRGGSTTRSPTTSRRSPG